MHTPRNRPSDQAQLDGAEEAILGFWLIRGGADAGVDAELATEFFDGKEALDAPQLGAHLHKVLGVRLDDPALSKQLLSGLLSAPTRFGLVAPIGESPEKLSPEALHRWVRWRYPRFELEQLLEQLQLHKIVAKYLLRGNGQETPKTPEKVHDCVRAAVRSRDITDAVYTQIAQHLKAKEACRSENTGANGKFTGTFEGKFASAQTFHDGLDRHVGLPNQNVLEAVINEHRHAPNSDTQYETSNYKLVCTPEEELVRRRLPRANVLLPAHVYAIAGFLVSDLASL